MSFRKLTRLTSRGQPASTDVRVSNRDGRTPKVIIPGSIIDQIGARIGASVDLMIDDDARPKKLAIVTPGKAAKLLAVPGSSRAAVIFSMLLRSAIPETRTTPVSHKITLIDGCPALVIELPNVASSELEGQ